MFGASFVAPVLMGLDPNLAIMMSGVAAVIFLLATRGRVPSHPGRSLSFVGVAVQRLGARIIHATMPPIVTGAVVMLIGCVCVASGPGSRSSSAWSSDLSGVGKGDWIGLPSFHGPSFQWSAILVALPVVIALVAENAGHVKAVGEMTGDSLDDRLGTAIAADGIGSVLSTAVGGPPDTTNSENIGVMAATRLCSTAAYCAAAGFALLFGLCPKFGAVVAAIPGGALGNPPNLVPAAAGIIIGWAT